jgi:hypothetical protein
MSTRVHATITWSHLLRLLPPRTAFVFVAFLSVAITGTAGSISAQTSSPIYVQQVDKHLPNPEVNAPSYMNDSVERLVQRIPELRALQPALDQGPLPMILEGVGEKVDERVDRLGALVAKEVVAEEEVNLAGKPLGLQEDEYDYFIVMRGDTSPMNVEEYRRAKEGKKGTPGVKFLSSGFASSILYFAKQFQPESTYRYLGEDVVGTRSAYAVAFAQNPWKATVQYKISKPDGAVLNTLMQGIAWVDKGNFQILRIRTDILPNEILVEKHEGKDRLQTVVTFGEVQPEGAPSSLWLPTEAYVHEQMEEHTHSSDTNGEVYFARLFRNVHHFSAYRCYRAPEGDSARLGNKNAEEEHPYLEEPTKELVKRIPELKGIRVAADQHALPMILNKTGKEVDEFFDNLVDVVAHEEIRQERLGSHSSVRASESVRDSYLILRHVNGMHADFDEFRMDEEGNRMDQVGLTRGFLVTAGFALICIHFSLEFQWDSRFRYLGEQTMNGREMYVVAFAQLPEVAHLAITMSGPRGTAAHMLVQGVAWVDKGDFHIVRMRTDLLVRQPAIALEEQTTKVSFGEVRLMDVANPLWLPRDVNVYVKLGTSGEVHAEEFRNVHRYTDYRRYRVSTKMVNPN